MPRWGPTYMMDLESQIQKKKESTGHQEWVGGNECGQFQSGLMKNLKLDDVMFAQRC